MDVLMYSEVLIASIAQCLLIVAANVSQNQAADLSTLFDVGGIFGTFASDCFYFCFLVYHLSLLMCAAPFVPHHLFMYFSSSCYLHSLHTVVFFPAVQFQIYSFGFGLTMVWTAVVYQLWSWVIFQLLFMSLLYFISIISINLLNFLF